MTTVGASRPRFGLGWAHLRHYKIELLWGAFAAANYAVMLAWPSWGMVPFHLLWISLTLVYGLRAWATRPTLVVFGGAMLLTGFSIALGAFRGIHHWGELADVPLIAAMFLAMAWHARLRTGALRVAEQNADVRRAMLERQERFIEDASHVLRTPLTIARGHLELVRAQAAASPAVEVALDELGRIDSIIERLLVLANANHPEALYLSEIDLDVFLEDLFLRWSEVAPRAWRLGPLASGWLWCDPAQLRAALDALLDNAVKYTTERDVIRLDARSDGIGGAVIEVQDEGCGVAREDVDRIFDRFARADASRTRATDGIGLGLAIADAIARGHRGHCTVTSDGHGSSFALHLPRFAAVPTPAAPRSLST